MKPIQFPLGLGVAVLFTAIYLAMPTRDYYWDGIAFATKIEMTRTSRDLFSVHHLLYDFIGEIPYKIAGGRIRALYLMQWANGIAAGVLLWLAYRLFRSLGVAENNAAACAAVVGAAATFWKFTTDADSYIISNLFLLATYLSLGRSTTRAGVFHAGAMVMHQLSALFYPVGLALIWRRSPERFWREAARYTAIVAGLTVLAYATAFQLSLDREAPRFFDWITFHADVPFSFRAARNARLLALGTGKLFVGGKFSLTALVSGAIAAILIALSISDLARHRRRLLPLGSQWHLFLWIFVYAAFLFFWEPQNTFYRLFYLVPLVALLAAATRQLRARPLICLAVALGCWNLCQFIYPKTLVKNNPPLAAAMREHASWPQGTGVVFADFIPDLWTIHYFNMQAAWIGMDRPDAGRLSAYADAFARTGRKLYVDWTYLNRAGCPAPRFTFQPVGDWRPDRAPCPAH